MEVYTKKVNAHIQRDGTANGGSSSVTSEDVDERRELLQDNTNEPDLVKVKTK